MHPGPGASASPPALPRGASRVRVKHRGAQASVHLASGCPQGHRDSRVRPQTPGPWDSGRWDFTVTSTPPGSLPPGDGGHAEPAQGPEHTEPPEHPAPQLRQEGFLQEEAGEPSVPRSHAGRRGTAGPLLPLPSLPQVPCSPLLTRDTDVLAPSCCPGRDSWSALGLGAAGGPIPFSALPTVPPGQGQEARPLLVRGQVRAAPPGPRPPGQSRRAL